MEILVALFLVLSSILIIGGFFYWKINKLKKDVEKNEQKMRRGMYELSILKELGDRVGYSLNIENIIDIITGSLHQFIQYSAASYMLIKGDHIIFKVTIGENISHEFIADTKERMLNSLSALLDKDLKNIHIEEIVLGA